MPEPLKLDILPDASSVKADVDYATDPTLFTGTQGASACNVTFESGAMKMFLDISYGEFAPVCVPALLEFSVRYREYPVHRRTLSFPLCPLRGELLSYCTCFCGRSLRYSYLSADQLGSCNY